MLSREKVKALKKRFALKGWFRIRWAHSGASVLAIGLFRVWESPNLKNMR
jgi:hypothetical protein